MEDSHVTEMLSAYLDGCRTAATNQRVAEHLDSCKACATLFDDLSRNQSLLQGEYKTLYVASDFATTVMVQAATIAQRAQVRRVARVVAVMLVLACVLVTVAVVSPLGLALWPLVHLMSSIIRGVYGFRGAVSVAWTVSGLCIAIGFAVLWIALMRRFLASSRNEAVL